MQTTTTKRDVYEIVNELVIGKLENGILPWVQPWQDAGLPRNLITRRPYRGINVLLLNSLGYPYPEFLTFNQAQDIGARIKKGEKGHLVVLWTWVEDREGKKEKDSERRKRPMLRYYFVFNVAQCLGIPERSQPVEIPPRPLEACDAIVRGMPNPPRIVHEEGRAYYRLKSDMVNMPPLEMFKSSEGYYGTLFHELVHSTGHSGRLNRKELGGTRSFERDSYTIEELTAEIGSCYLAAHAGIGIQPLLDNSRAYLNGWLAKLSNDRRFIVYASAQAQRAFDHILGITHEDHRITEGCTAPD